MSRVLDGYLTREPAAQPHDDSTHRDSNHLESQRVLDGHMIEPIGCAGQGRNALHALPRRNLGESKPNRGAPKTAPKSTKRGSGG